MLHLRPLHAILVAIAIAAIALPLLVIGFAPAPPREVAGLVSPPPVVVPRTVIPPVEPAMFRDVAPDDARAFNETVAFADGPNPAARPYTMRGGADDLVRARDCLAAALWYEAGDDAVGEQAVAQVVLNRLRHPAFPKSVCGVVFQGAERRTGCQFTFTCDGAMRRTPSEAAWKRAQDIAAAALAGRVHAPVGLATHYHTDWVVPYWSASLDKIARVGTHLFFRWTGWWGTPAAFNRTPAAMEQPVTALAALSPAHGLGAALTEADGAVIAATPFFGRAAMPLPSDPNTFITALNPAQAATFSGMALASCGERAKCRFMGWTDVDQLPFTAALSPQQIGAMSFSYIRDRASGLERTLWNCAEFKRAPGQCMKRITLRVVPGLVPTIEEDAATRGPAELDGVRRKSATEPAPTASPSPAAATAAPRP